MEVSLSPEWFVMGIAAFMLFGLLWKKLIYEKNHDIANYRRRLNQTNELLNRERQNRLIFQRIAETSNYPGLVSITGPRALNWETEGFTGEDHTGFAGETGLPSGGFPRNPANGQIHWCSRSEQVFFYDGDRDMWVNLSRGSYGATGTAVSEADMKFDKMIRETMDNASRITRMDFICRD